MIPNGVAIYHNTSLLNHSCRPNCIIVFEKSKMMVRCIEPIMKDQEVLVFFLKKKIYILITIIILYNLF